MKRMKKALCLVLACMMTVMLAACGNKDTNNGESSANIKIGVILVGDETEGYTKAHMDGIKEAAKELGIADNQIIWKY
ncbi:MAG: BMP family ABC transporter substrate-binding protein, partial [Lachnospiraceae bacterium]